MDLGEVDAAAVAVARSNVTGLDYADLVLRDLERGREIRAHTVRPLARVNRVQLVVVPPEQPVRHFQSDVLLDRLVRDDVDDRVRARVRGIATHEWRGDGDRRAVEVAGELLGRRRLHRLEEVERRRQDLVLDVDLAKRLVGDVLALGRDDRDRRADLEDFLVEKEARRIGRAEEDVGVLRREVSAVEDSLHARELLCLADVDARDLRVRVTAAERPHEEHARHPHVLGVLAEIRDDADALHTRDVRAGDLECGARRFRLRRAGTCRRGEARKLVPVCRDDSRDHLGLLGHELLPVRVERELVPIGVAQACRVFGVLGDTDRFDTSHVLSPSLLHAVSGGCEQRADLGFIELRGVPLDGDLTLATR